MFATLLLFCISCTDVAFAEVYRTLSGYDHAISKECMDNKHPFKPKTFSCEDQHQSHVSSLLSTITQMLNKVDETFEPSSSLYPTFPGLSTGILNIHSTYSYDPSTLPRYAVFGTQIGSNVGYWRAEAKNTNQALVIGSSVPFVFEKIVTAGSGSLNWWVNSFKLYYTLDNDYWTQYENIIQSNTDDNSLFELLLNPFVARAIYIQPYSWNVEIAMRVEVYVSKYNYKAQPLKERSFSSIYYGYNVVFGNIFNEYLGYDYLKVKTDEPMTKSVACFDNHQWIIVSAGYRMKWDRFVLINSAYQDDVKYLNIFYTSNGVDWTSYNDSISLYPTINRNYDQLLDIYAISLKFDFHGAISTLCLRLEVYVSEA